MGHYESFEAVTAGALRHACAALQLPLSAESEKALVLDYRRLSSNYWDACGAASCRLQAYWINRTKATEDPLGQRPKAVLERLTDLIGLIND